jgi:hypothetical protein
MMRSAFEDRLRRVRFPEPASDLRERALTAALRNPAPPATWADETWFSGRWRLGAVALLFALFALDAFDRIPAGSGYLLAERPGAVATETAQAARDAARQAGLPDATAELLECQALLAALQPGDEEQLAPRASDFGRSPLKD